MLNKSFEILFVGQNDCYSTNKTFFMFLYLFEINNKTGWFFQKSFQKLNALDLNWYYIKLKIRSYSYEMGKDYYQVLGLQRGASDADIAKAYLWLETHT